MKDPMLRAMLQPTNMLFEMVLWPGGSWSIRNVSDGRADVHDLMMMADLQQEELTLRGRRIVAEGASAHAISILRPTFEEIETICEATR